MKIEASEAATVFFSSLSGRQWFLQRDFSSLIPPEKELWIEMKADAHPVMPRWGFLLSSSDLATEDRRGVEEVLPPPLLPLLDESRWAVSGLVVLDHPVNGPIGPIATVLWLTDVKGQIPLMSDGQSSLVTVPYGVADQMGFNESIRRTKELIYPTLLAISMLNDGKATLSELDSASSDAEPNGFAYRKLRLLGN